jgi:transcriptional regulator with XRE-family HTH domain
MCINTILKSKNMTKYKLAKKSGVPHTTVLDICSGKTKLNKCTAETVYKLAKALDVQMDTLIAGNVEKRAYFENFKSAVCHKLKRLGDFEFIETTLLSGEIRKLYDMSWYPECVYLLAMVDYLSRENDLPLAKEYEDIRKARLSEIVYPAGILVMSAFSNNEKYKELCVSEAIPEFARHNIVERDVRNVY